jgi:GTP cyclohydrolase IA
VSDPSAPDRAAAAAAIDAFLRAIGRDGPDIVGTGERVADMFIDDLCAGYTVDTRALALSHVLPAEAPAVVSVRDLPVVTMCPHHLLPSLGTATVAFKATARIIGLGAIAGIVEAHARRLALQERIGEAVVADLEAVLEPEWVGCRLVLTHGCMVARGERVSGATVETLALRGPDDRAPEAHQVLGVGTTASGGGGVGRSPR